MNTARWHWRPSGDVDGHLRLLDVDDRRLWATATIRTAGDRYKVAVQVIGTSGPILIAAVPVRSLVACQDVLLSQTSVAIERLAVQGVNLTVRVEDLASAARHFWSSRPRRGKGRCGTAGGEA